jgi:hypothetical protein
MFTTIGLALLLASGHLQEAETRPPGTEVIEEVGPAYSFSYSWPLEAAAIPALDILLREDANSERERIRETAAESAAEFGTESGAPPHEFTQQWRVDAHLPELVALSAEIYTYAGGAHGNSLYDALIWDRSAREPIAFEDLFTDADAALAAISPAFCAALQQERARRREGEEGRDDCPAIADHPVALVTGPSGRIETFRVLIEPYAAGSYAEGTYEIDVPISDEFLTLIRARFGTAFVWR